MACEIKTAINGANSELFETIYDKFSNNNQKEAEALYVHFESSEFIKEFGDYRILENASDFEGRVDSNGEPKLFLNEENNKHYYINENKEQISFPLVSKGLRGVFDYEQINTITSQLALSYFTENTNIDFNNLDFENSGKLPNLKQYIYDKTVSKIKELEADDMYLNAYLLEDGLVFLDEWVKNVDNFYKRIGIKRIDTEGELEEDLQMEGEETKDPVFNKASFERDSKDAISTNAKLRLSLMKDTTKTDSIWNESEFVPFDDIYSTLLIQLSNQVPIIQKNGQIEDIFELYKDQIAIIAEKKPYLKDLLNILNDKGFDLNKQNEFVQAFRLHKNNFLLSELDQKTIQAMKDNGAMEWVKSGQWGHTTKTVSDSGNKSSRIRGRWTDNFKSLFLNQDNSYKGDVKTQIEKVKSEFEKILTFVGDKNTEKREDAFGRYIDSLFKLGISIEPQSLFHYLDEGGTKQYDDNYQFAKFTKTVTNTIIALDTALVEIAKPIKPKKQGDVEASFKNPLLTQSIFKDLADSEAFFLPEGGDSSIMSGGKSKWLYSYPSYISTRILMWKKDPAILRAHYESSANNQSSYLMKWLLGEEIERLDSDVVSKQRLEALDFGVFSAFQEQMGDSSAPSDISKNDYLIDHVNKVLKNDFIRGQTPGDKTTDIQIKTGLHLKSFESFRDGQVNLKFETQKAFLDYFSGDFERMREALGEVQAFKNNPEKQTIHYHFKADTELYNEDGTINYKSLGNAFKSQIFEDLSYDSKSKNPLVIKIKQLIYDENGLPKDFQGLKIEDNPTGRIGEETFKIGDLIQEYINSELSKGIIETGKMFRKQGIFETTENGKTVNKFIDSDTYNSYEFNAPLQVASDFYINSLIQNIEFGKMFVGDPAFFKNMVDYKKRVPATYTDGLQLRLLPGQERFNIATVSSIYIASPFLEELKSTIGDKSSDKYGYEKNEDGSFKLDKNGEKIGKINAADAQAWITPQRWEFLVKGIGKWSKTHDSLYKKMLEGGKQQYTEAELKIAAQPLKGVYFEMNGKTPVYLKYSQAVLTKNMITDSGLQRIYDKMTKDENGNELDFNNQIHEVITLDGVKVGASIPTTIHNIDGSIKDDFTLNKQVLSNSGWKLQQDLPTKTFKDTEVGSQIQKNIFAGLKFNLDKTFYIGNEEFTGKELVDDLTNTTGLLSDLGWDSLQKEFDIDANGKIKNIQGFYKTLVAELEKRGGSENVIEALKKEIVLYGIPQANTKVINVFASIMNKRLVKIKTNGGSFIQMSNFGLNKDEANQKGVLWSPNALKTTNEPSQYVDENGIVKIRPGGILISGSFIAKYIPNYRELGAEKLFGYVNENGETVKGIVDESILNNLIGYRIPNQGMASNDALQIIGILPEENGDTVVAYTGITTKTGSDFDIDKMFIMMPSFEFKDGRLVYTEYDKSNPTKEGLQNHLIELYKAVLTSEHNIDAIMTPIDNDIFEADIKDLIPLDNKASFFHFDSIKDIDLLYYFRGGKAGVGQEANAVVDISRMGSLYFKNHYIGWGHKNENGDTILDNEYSKELSKEDLEYYASAMNTTVKDIRDKVAKVKIGDSLTAILNAFVDIAKDPYITRGNWVTTTTNTGNLLLRSGMHPLYVSAFMAQPIIRDYIEFQAGRESILTNDSGDIKFKFKQNEVLKSLEGETLDLGSRTVLLSTIYSSMIRNERSEITRLNEQSISKNIKLKNPTDEQLKLINNVVKTLIDSHNNIFNNESIKVEELSLEQLRNQIKGKSNVNTQIAVLDKFLSLQDLSKKIRENVDVSKTDTDGLGGDIGTLMSKNNLKQYLFEKEDEGADKTLMGIRSKFDNTVLSRYEANIITKTIDLVVANPELFPQGQKNVQDMFNEISQDLYGNPAFNKDLLNDLQSEYYSYTMAKFLDITKEESVDLISNLPQEFDKFRRANKGKYLITDELELKDGNQRVNKFIQMNNRKKSLDFEKSFTDSWKDLIEDNPEFAEKLIKYSYLTSGFKISSTQFYTFIPHEYFTKNNINKFIKEFVKKPENQADFIDDFYLNNYDNTKYVPNVFTSDLDISKNDLVDGLINTGFTLKESGKARYYVKHISDTAAKKFGPKTGFVYKLEGYTEDGRGIYTKVTPKSYKVTGNSFIVGYGEDYSPLLFTNRNLDSANFELSQELKNSVVLGRETKRFDVNLDNSNTIKTDKEEPMTVLALTPEVAEGVETKQLSLAEQLEQDKQRWKEVKDKWIESGRTEADFNSMSNEEKEHTIKECLGL